MITTQDTREPKYLAAMTGKEVLIWEVGTRQEMTRLMHGDSVVREVIFSADGRYLAASNGNQISIWDWKRGREIARLRHGDTVDKVAFTPDGSRLVSASWGDNMVRVWAWQKGDLVADACSRLERNLSLEEWRTSLGDEPYHETCPGLPVPEK